MVRPLILPLCGLALLGASLGAGFELAGAAPLGAARAQDSHTVFREAFKKAQVLNAAAEMQKLVKKNVPEAVSWIMETAEGLSNNPTDELADRMIALRNAWKAAMETSFAENMEKYFALLSPAEKDERAKLKSRYDQANAKYWANVEKKEAQVYGLLSLELEGLADAFTTLGDHYFAAQCWLLRSNCWEENNRGEDADLYKVCESCKHAAESLKQIDLREASYVAAKNRYESLKGQGFDKASGEEGGEAGPEGGPPAAGSLATGAVLTATLSFELVDKLEEYERPSYYIDELHGMWPSLGFGKKGSKTKIASLGELSPMALRTASAAVGIDLDGDDKVDVNVPMTGNLEPVRFKLGTGDAEREWGFLAMIGTQSDMYQGVQMNMAPSDESLSLYLAPAASVVGDLGGVPVRVFDDNMDGVYGSYPLTWAHVGTSAKHLQPELDSVLIGKAKRAVPYSEFLQVEGKWYQLEPQGPGTTLKATEVTLETGKVKVAFKGGKPTWVVLRGAGRYENSYFDVTDGADVPVGKYTLYFGELRKGKKQQTCKTLILPGDSPPKYDVAAGKTTTVELGAPFSFDFTFEEDEHSITLKGNSVVIVGAAGERYERPWNCVPRPEVSWREAGAKKGSKPEKTDVISENDQFTKYGWAAAWFPLDLVLEKKGNVESSELQLSEKKNKLFGKIDSEWKGE
ncbi:MAG: hypothetical protein H6828_14775 [Planctomycetes bacterium]|nr:hypothetical protein [Planctomycetota bacterium]